MKKVNWKPFMMIVFMFGMMTLSTMLFGGMNLVASSGNVGNDDSPFCGYAGNDASFSV